MGIRLTFEITSPLDPDDRELLTGVAMMTLAIANHEMAKGIPQQEGEGPQPCGSIGPELGTYCISEVGHKGRHKYRPFDMGAVN